jgi:glutaredoxin
MYGTTWCPDCIRAKQVLAKHNIAYDFHDIGEDKEALAYVERLNKGMRSVPIIVFPNGTTLVEPTNSELESRLLEMTD